MTYWTYWGQKSFDACQQQWAFKNRFASALATKKPLRREAFLLSKLQTIYSWRGSLVDKVISDFIVPKIKTEWEFDERDVLDYARQLCNRQLQFALAQKFREPGMTLTKGGDDYAALFEVEYDIELGADVLESVWADVELALKNFFTMPDLLSKLTVAFKLTPQRMLDFSVLSAKGRAKPDLIAFYQTMPPHIFDWKVHTFGTTDYRRQLAAYALALKLTDSKKNADIIRLRGGWQATDMKLFEVQLLTGKVREYSLTEDDIDDLESQIAVSYKQMILAVDGTDNNNFDQNVFLSTRYAETCVGCPFQKICSEVLCVKSKQTTFL